MTEVQSPFLPGTKIQYAWDSTSLGLLKTCPRLYQYIMIDGWGTKDESIHLYFGREYHSTLEEYDRLKVAGASHKEAMIEALRQLLIRTKDFAPDEDTRAGKYKNRRMLVGLVIDYLDKYERDPAQTFILESGKPAVELSFRFELDWGPKGAKPEKDIPHGFPAFSGQPYLLSGHLDRVVSFQDHLFVMDRKTSLTTLGDYYFDQYEPNNQMSLYTLASQIVIQSPIKGVIIDAAQILLDKPNRFVRGFTYRTPDQLDEWVHDLRYWFSLAEGFAENDYWPMNDTACDKYGGCRFRDVCRKSPQVREKLLAGKFTKLEEDEKWNPLKPR